MDNQTCSQSPCSAKKWLMSALVVFVFTFLFDWLVHGNLLMGIYTATANLWRPIEEMQKFMPICIAKHAALALIFAAMYGCWRSKVTLGAVGSKDCPYKKSMGFGLMIGLMLGINAGSGYIYLAIPEKLALAWLAAEAVKWMLAAALLSAVCGRCTKANA